MFAQLHCHAIAHAVSRRPLASDVRIQVQETGEGMMTDKAAWGKSLPRTAGFHCNYYTTTAPLLIKTCYNRPIIGSTKELSPYY